MDGKQARVGMFCFSKVIHVLFSRKLALISHKLCVPRDYPWNKTESERNSSFG